MRAMRRISLPLLLAALLAAFAVAPAAGSAAAAHKSHRVHHRSTRHKSEKHSRHVVRHKRKPATRRHRAVRHVRTRAKSLRTVVAAHRGCLTSLDTQSRRLLALRAGNSGKVRTQAAAARALRVSRTREQLLEQISLFELRGNVPGVCPATGAATTLSPSAQLTVAPSWQPAGTV